MSVHDDLDDGRPREQARQGTDSKAPEPQRRHNGSRYPFTEVVDSPETRQVLRELGTLTYVQYGLERDRIAETMGISPIGLDRLVEQSRSADQLSIPKASALAISAEEFENARLTPKCIVEHYLYADTALLLAAGATGKTTLQLYEAVHIILGRDLYGLRVVTPGSVLIVTAEDSRELLVARLRKIVQGMNLSESETTRVRHGLRILDVCGETARLVSADAGGNLSVTDIVDRIIEGCREDPPVLIVFDPAISFGAGESRLNDNEQALINASRRIIKKLDCAVRYIHHIGKEASRNKIMDQYAGRSGSALPDGSRMVVVLQPWDEDSGGITEISPPQHFIADKDCQIIVLNRPKLSYERPQQLLWIKRTAYVFESSLDVRIPPAAKTLEEADQIERFLRSDLARCRYHTRATVEAMHKDLGMSRNGIRRALAELDVSGRVAKEKRPDHEKQPRGAREFLSPVDRVDGH